MENMHTLTHYFACYGAFPISQFTYGCPLN